MNNVRLFWEYIKWYMKAKNRHGLHSPFLYDFAQHCLYGKQNRDIFISIEYQRRQLKNNYTKISFTDPGAGSRGDLNTAFQQRQTTLSRVARRSLQPAKNCRLFYRMIKHYQYNNILELGTCMGITTSYFSKANPQAYIHTIEGVDLLADIAAGVFKNTGADNILLHRGTFDQKLPDLFDGQVKWDMVFIDGDHTGESLFKYFLIILKHISKDGVVIADDIRWSESMFQAWERIQKHPATRLSVDLFTMGLVFVRPGLSKENFSLRF